MSVINGKDEQFEPSNNPTSLTDGTKLITTINNPRCGLTSKKYQKKIYQRRNEVRDLLFKGYSPQEIIDKLHSSQSTISRDIAFIHGSVEKHAREYGKSVLGNHVDAMNGTTELVKRAWEILDNPKTNDKMILKTIELINDCYYKRLTLYNNWLIVLKLKQITDEVNMKENYFKGFNIDLDYDSSKSIEEIRSEMYEKREKSIRERKDAIFK
ncbi:MAG: hypothetical protein L0H53_04040 [Candidatus Nitrosocosmicus sp.]|nr:hypothetical protein [Candidatus Nitrosocosmicus sp.]